MELDVEDGFWSSWEDPFDTPVDWIDVQSVSFLSEGQPHWSIALAAKPPLAVDLEPGVLIAYGLVLDTGGDGIADYVVGIDNDAPQPGDFHVWVTDLASGETDEQIGPPYGFPVEFSHPDEAQPGDYPPGSPATMVFTFLGDLAPAGLSLGTTQFYIWTSTTTDGEVVAWDYAPDQSWLRVAASAQAPVPEPTQPSAPEVEPEARVSLRYLPGNRPSDPVATYQTARVRRLAPVPGHFIGGGRVEVRGAAVGFDKQQLPGGQTLRVHRHRDGRILVWNRANRLAQPVGCRPRSARRPCRGHPA
jgi:hypothetical protein